MAIKEVKCVEYPMRFPNLEAEIAARGLKKSAIADSVGISVKAFRNKRIGLSEFTWQEACQIQKVHFPDKTKDYLFDRHPSDR